jgi:hypothetical protein
MASVDLIDYQVGSRKFPNCEVGREKEMILSKSIGRSEVSSSQQGSLIGGDSCGLADHVNADDENLNTSITNEEN